MKNIFKFIFFTSALIFSACSSNDENTDPSEVLLKKVVTKNYDQIYETTFTYDGKKLIEAKSYRQKKVFTYNNDNIVRIEWYQDPETDNFLLQYVDFEYYPDGKLKRFKMFLDAPKTVNFFYNSDNTVIFNLTTDYNDYYSYSGLLTIENNEVVQYDFIDGNSSTESRQYHYDNKNHPLKNVIGYEKLMLFNYFYKSMHWSGFSTNGGNNSNLIYSNYVEDPNIFTDYNTYEYNGNDFPIAINIGDEFAGDRLYYY